MDVNIIAFRAMRRIAHSDRATAALDRLIRPFNPFSPTRHIDPYPLYDAARAKAPIYFDKVMRTWIITGYEECEQAFRIPTSVDRSDFLEFLPPYTKVEQSTIDLFASTMLMRDPPDHTRLRRIVNRAFTPRAVAGLEPSIDKIVGNLLDDLATRDRIDAQHEFCDRIPIFAISDMLGLPRGEWDRFKALSDTMIRFVDPMNAFDPGQMDRAVREFREVINPLIDERRANPRDDMLTRLVQAEDEGDRLDREELLSMVALLMVAGHETTAGLLGLSLIALDRDRDARRQLLDAPELAENAIEELLRFDSPVQATDRFPTEEAEIAGQTVGVGEPLLISLGAANRDPRRYENPNRLVLDRPDPRPMSFGHGIHYCLGAALARLEATIAIPRFLEAFPEHRVDHGNVDFKRNVTLRGPTQLPIELRP